MADDSFKQVTRRGYIGAAALGLAGAGAGAWSMRRTPDEEPDPVGPTPTPTATPTPDPEDTDDNEAPEEDRSDDENVDDGNEEEDDAFRDFDSVDRYVTAVDNTLDTRIGTFGLLQKNTIKNTSTIPKRKAHDPYLRVGDTYIDSQYLLFELDQELDGPEVFTAHNSEYVTLANEGHPVFDVEDDDERTLAVAVRKETKYRDTHMNALAQIYKELSGYAAELQRHERSSIRGEQEEYSPAQAVKEQSLDTLYRRARQDMERFDTGTDEYEQLSALTDRLESGIRLFDGAQRHYRDASDLFYFTRKRSFFDDGDCVCD